MIQAPPDKPKQRTPASPARVEGRGLFSGAAVTATVRPASADTGVVFRRTDLPGAPEIPARIDFVTPRPRRTALETEGASVEMVEHCLSALAGLHIDNAYIDVDGPEIPAGDGSASLFIDAIDNAGITELDVLVQPLVVTEPITVREGDATLAALPCEGANPEMVYVMDYGERSFLGRQSHTYTLNADEYRREIAPARTFSTHAEAKAAWERGLFRHLTAKDMLVIGEAGPIENELRFPDEPVRHKMLDLVGDLSLVGQPIHARIVAIRSGHALNHQLARELVEVARRREQSSNATPPAMDIRAIQRLLPHRYPMILVDRVLEIDADRRAVGVKNVTINEPFFQGHYPATPIMPGVLIVEAMCQLAGLMLSQKLERTGKIAVLLSLDKVKLRRPVTPGDQLVMETEAVKTSTRFGDVQCRAFVAGDLVAEARVKFMMVDAEQDA